jgi:hypothetical protein
MAYKTAASYSTSVRDLTVIIGTEEQVRDLRKLNGFSMPVIYCDNYRDVIPAIRARPAEIQYTGSVTDLFDGERGIIEGSSLEAYIRKEMANNGLPYNLLKKIEPPKASLMDP